jgi:ATP-dependent Clp protease ATP-binding subunit ClpC
MKLVFHLLVEEHTDGTVLAEVLGVPGLQAFETSKKAALASLRTTIEGQIGWRDRSFWRRLKPAGKQELRTLEVSVPLDGSARLPISVVVLVTALRLGGAQQFLVSAPRIAGFQAVVTDAGEIDSAVTEALKRFLKRWKPGKILKAHLDGEAALDRLVIGGKSDPKSQEAESPDEESSESDSGGEAELTGDDDVLGICGVDLTRQASDGKLDATDRRDALVDRILSILAGENRNSVILVGRPDVGKTALIHEVARRLNDGAVPEALKTRKLWSVTANNLIAGMAYYGEWQGRAQKLVRQLRSGRQLLYMGDPEEILSAGRYRGSDNNLGRYLRPYMETGDVVVVCECSEEAYTAQVHREPSFMHAFCRVDVPETEPADTDAIIQAAARRAEAKHSLRIELDALTAVCQLTRRFLPYRSFPGKAIRVLQDTVRDHLPSGIQSIGRAEVVSSFTRATGLPAFVLSDDIPLPHAAVLTHFQERLLGQPEAVDAMVDLITVLKAGLNDPNKPLGSFFFVGPTGVGKTEMAKVLAEFLFGSRDRMLRFDMSEYSSADALPRLIGSAWRSDEEGTLTRRVREQPFCVVLLDELEKAHPDVFDALLGVLGEGRLADAGGRSADFRNAIIVMTSNLGAGRRDLQSVGFAREGSDSVDTRLQDHFVKAAEAFFRPEFFNRFDRIVAFRALSPEAVRLITRRELGKLLMREGIVRRNLLVEVDEAVISRLAEQGFHPHYGARPLQRAIERAVILPLARILVDGQADHRHLVRFTVRDGKIHPRLVVVDAGEEPAMETATPVDRRLEADLAGVLRAVALLRTELELADAGELVQGLKDESSRLLSQTREPTFWDTPDAARQVLQRIYRLERVVKRLDGLTERAARLEERIGQLRRQRDRRSLPDLAAQVEKLETEVSFLQAEIAGASSGEDGDAALLRITAVSPDAEEWTRQLVGMYEAWAERKGFQWEPLPSATRKTDPDQAAAICVQGGGVYQFLRGEAGLHKLTTGSADSRRRLLSRVTVVPLRELPASGAALNPHAQDGDSASGDDGREVARVYQVGKHRFVRDPRTGVRITHVDAVLKEGQIDAFLLAHLRSNPRR